VRRRTRLQMCVALALVARGCHHSAAPFCSLFFALLFHVLDTNRIICETPSNDASSRSHCIFTIYVECREVGGSKIRRSKLHLVDCQSRDRISKLRRVVAGIDSNEHSRFCIVAVFVALRFSGRI
jgi:hypothetical protein